MTDPRVPTVRSFSRAVTLRVGAFDDRFLGRDRPLREARLLFEVGREGTDARTLRGRLDLDSGYLSRLLSSLEQQGLVALEPLESDRRVKAVRLTAAGEAELAELNERGDGFAESLLEPLTEEERVRLVDAMAEVERLLSLSCAKITTEEPAAPDARWCVQQYFAELAGRFDDGFEVTASISADDDDLRAPSGAFLLVRLDGKPVGCGALKTEATGIASIKRMWIAERVRGIGVGRRLLAALEEEARRLGFDTVHLETNRNLGEAQALYRRSGYREVAPFNDEPYAHHWFEKTL